MDYRLQRVLFLIQVAALLVISAASTACAAVKQANAGGRDRDRRWIAYCPDGGNLCAWSRDGLAAVPLRLDGGSRVFDFAIGNGGELIVLRCGHQASGELMVIGHTSRLVVRRTFASDTICGDLSHVYGQTPRGDIVLCSADNRCDVWVGNAADEKIHRELPERCRSPRFSSDGGIACLVDGSVSTWPGAGVSDISDFYLLSRSRAIVARSGGVYEVEESGGIRRLPGETPLWLAKVGERVYYTACLYRNTTPTGCELYNVTESERANRIWSSSTLIPRYLQGDSPTSVMLDAWGAGRRELVRIDLVSGRSKTIWSDVSPRWQ